MKLYGKRVLALIITIAMALSLCSFTVFAADVSLYVGGTQELTVSAANAIWSSSDTAVATVSNGMVTGVSKGTAVITAKDSGTLATLNTWQVRVNIDTSKPITNVDASTSGITVPYGTSLSSLKSLLDKITLTATYQGQGTQVVVANNWTCATAYDAYTRGTYVFSPIIYGAETATVDQVVVTVGTASIDITFTPSSLEVPLGTPESLVLAALPTDATVKLMSGSTIVQSMTWSIGNQFTDWVSYPNYSTIASSSYTFATDLASNLKGNYTYINTDLQVNVATKSLFSVEDFSTSMTYTDSYYADELELDKIILTMLEDKFSDWGISITSVNADGSYVYGMVSNGDYVLDIDYNSTAYSNLMAGYNLTEEVSYEAVDANGVKYYGDINVIITSGYKSYKYDMGSAEYNFEFGKWLAQKLSADMIETLSHVEFYIYDANGGDLYANKALDSFEDGEVYYYNNSFYEEFALEDLYFVPNGVEGSYTLEYVAYGKYNEVLEGTITINCREFLMVTATISTDDYLAFDSAAIENMLAASSYAAYDLISIDNLRVTGGGNLYYEYDPSTTNNQNNKKITTSSTPSTRSSYYASGSSDYYINSISYVPATNSTGGTITITFNLYLRDGSKTRTPSAIYQINVVKKADITVEAGINGLVQVNPMLFQSVLNERMNSTRYDVAYVVISGAPRSLTAGSLVTNAQEIKTAGDKTFYMAPTPEQYDLCDLYYLAGSTKGTTTQATFKIYYYRNSGYVSGTPITGTIDFVTTVSSNLSAELKASKTLPFSAVDTLSAFLDLGGNENVYVTFNKLPEGGKLYYNWGSPAQEDVKTGTAYYIGYYNNVKLVSNITFVPSYTDKKTTQTITIPITAYNAQNKPVSGTITLTVTHAYYSDIFSDVVSEALADSADFLYNQKITTGTTATTFNPYGNVKRAEFVTFLWRAAGEPDVTGVTNKFTDVKPTGEFGYAYKAILWADQNGITNGTSANTFSPASNVTHQELLTFLYRYDVTYLGHSGTGSLYANYTDIASVATWATDAVKWADAKGVLTGTSILPTTAGTRSTVAVWLHRMLTL